MATETIATESDRFKINSETVKAVSENIVFVSNAYLDIQNPTEGAGSGTFVLIDDRLFLATCSHAVPARPHKRLSIIPRKIEPFEKMVVDLVGFAKAEGTIDVAYLEFSPDLLNVVEKQAITLDRIRPNGPGEAKRLVYLTGFPSQLIKLTKTIRANGSQLWDNGFKMACHFDVPILPDSWPKPPKDSEPTNEETDLFMQYSCDDDLLDVATNAPSNFVHPDGSSGGGWWQGEETSGRVWSHDLVKLIGIQSSYYAPGKYVRGVQIHHWLRLLYKNEPKLRKTLKKKFNKLFA